MEKQRPKEQPWVLMAWVSFLALVITAPMIVAEESWVYRGAMLGAVLAILAWAALLLHSSLKEARRAETATRESDTAPVGTGGPVRYTPLWAGALVAASAIALIVIALVPQLGQILWAILAGIGALVVLVSLVFRHFASRRQPSEYDPAAEQVRSAEVPDEES